MAFAEILQRLDRVHPVEGSHSREELARRLDFLRRVFAAKVVFDLEGRHPIVAIVTGGTNVGKSEVFNALAGEKITAPDPRAGMTRRPGVLAGDEAFVRDPRFLPGYERRPFDPPSATNESSEELVFHYAIRPREFVLVDSPDVDSHRTENLLRAEHLLAAADVVVFVTSPSKYNDEACVLFLERALALGRVVHVVFNFLGDGREKVLADFRTAVPGTGPLPVTEIERFPIGEDVFARMKAGLSIVRLPEVPPRQELIRNALQFVRQESAAVIEVILRDLDGLESLRMRAQKETSTSRAAFSADLHAEKDPEVERVIGEVLQHFRVPVIDDILNAPSRAIQWVFRAIQGRESADVEAENLARKRRERLRRKVAEMVDALRAGTMRSMAEAASDPLVLSLMKRASAGTLGRPAEKDIETVWEETEPKIKAWRDGMRDEMIEKIRQSPNLRFFLQTTKAALQIGTGVLTAVLLGAPLAVDIATGSAVAKLTQFFLETFGNAYFEDKRQLCVKLQLERFDGLTKRFVLDPLDEAMPPRPSRGELEALARDIGSLSV